jgi:hypothetical protein
LTREVDARAGAERAAFVLAHGYAATSLLTYYGEGSLPVVQLDERARWSFEAPPSEALFAAPGLAFGAANSGFGARLPRRAEGTEVETYLLFRVSDPTGPVLEKD